MCPTERLFHHAAESRGDLIQASDSVDQVASKEGNREKVRDLAILDRSVSLRNPFPAWDHSRLAILIAAPPSSATSHLILNEHIINAVLMLTIGYVRVSTDRQAEQGVSLEAQEAKIRAMATVQGAELIDVIVDGGESAKSLNRPGLQRLMGLVNGGKVQAVIVAKLDRLTRSVKDLCGLLELFEKRKVALISVAEALDTGSAAGRLVITIMGAVSQWEREAIGERTRDALRHKRGNGERVGNIEFGYRLAPGPDAS